MRLDLIDLAIRVEKTFAVELPVEEYVRLQTVGDVYRLVLEKLNLEYLPAEEIEKLPRPYPSVIPPSSAASPLLNAAAVWRVLKSTIAVEFHVDSTAIREPTELHYLGND